MKTLSEQSADVSENLFITNFCASDARFHDGRNTKHATGGQWAEFEVEIQKLNFRQAHSKFKF